jgi:hypothetical protein
MKTDKQIKDAIASIWTTTSTATSESCRVIPRWKLSLKGKEVMQALRSVTSDLVVNGVYITRVKADRKKLGEGHFQLHWTYAMFYFRSFDEGTDSANSEDKMNAFLEAVASAFSDAPDLNLADDSVDNHDEMQVANIDTMDLKIHAAQCFLTVNLTVQPD